MLMHTVEEEEHFDDGCFFWGFTKVQNVTYPSEPG
jgi:hypothetical protein